MLQRLVFFVLLGAGTIVGLMVSERLALTVDVTATGTHTLSEDARLALEALDGAIVFTAYLPDLPVQRAEIERLTAPYRARDGRVQLTFVDPVSDPASASAAGVARHGELHLVSGTRREVLQEPGRRAIDLALNRMALRSPQWIVVLQGQGELDLDGRPGGLLRMAKHLELIGYRVIGLDPRQIATIPGNTAVLLAAGPTQPYPDALQREVDGLLDAGAGVLWLTRSAPVLLPTVSGLEALPGIVVDAAASRHGMDRPEQAIVSAIPNIIGTSGAHGFAVLPTTKALAWSPPETARWQQVGALGTGPTSWNETGEIHGEVTRDPEQGELRGPLDLGLLLQRNDGDGRLAIIGDVDFVTNDQIGIGDNLHVVTGLLRWLGHREELGAPEPAPDLDVTWSPGMAATAAVTTIVVMPLCYVGFGFWQRYRRRRA